MRRALLVGIDHYAATPLRGCINDALALAERLKTNMDGSPNFDCKVATSLSLVPGSPLIDRPRLRRGIEELFTSEADVALFYFSGHGTVKNLDGFLVTQDARAYDEGVSMAELLRRANGSKAREVVILLDCCHSGNLGAVPAIDNDKALLREGVSILTASRGDQVSVEVNGSGLFTGLVCAALDGGASDVIGKVTVASVYAYVDQALGAWEQRPLFKSHISKLLPLRFCKPEVPLEILRLLPKYFPTPDYCFALDPSFEPAASPAHPDNETVFGHLQKMRGARLLLPNGEEHMYYAAMNSKSCSLTPLGQFYWNLANGGKI